MKGIEHIKKVILTDFIDVLESGGRPKGGVTDKGEIPSLGAEHLNDQGGISFLNKKMISNSFYLSLSKGKIEIGDILIVKDGATTGKVSFIDNDFSFKNAAINEHLFRLKPKKDLDSKFLFYHLFSDFGKSQILKDFRGATVGGISKSFTDNIKIPLPPLETQKKIASILDKADELRQNDRKILEKYDQLAQSVFLEMFGDPVKNPFSYPVVTLKESCLSIKDGPHVSPKYVKKGVPFLTVNNIIRGSWDFSNLRFISQADHEVFRQKCDPQKGDILYTKGGTTGFAKYIDIDLKFSNWVHLAVLKFDLKKINGRFLESMLNSEYCYRQSQNLTRGIANRDLVLGQMGKIKLICPPLQIQEKFSDIIETIDMQKQLTHQSLQKSEELFQSLLQKAFRGEIS